MEKTKLLLLQTRNIIEKHKEFSKITGEEFNVFETIGIKNSEVKMHSAILAELLNGNGKHGQGDLFLKLFIETINESIIKESILKNIHFINSRYSTCVAEKYANEYGRIDLYIENNQNEVLIIENKIYTIEQENQLIRYFDYCVSKNKKIAGLIFLTIEGKEPNSSKSHNRDISKFVTSISYKNEIINWLEKCQKEVYNKPMLLYSLKQYQNLVKIITNQSTNTFMQSELVKYIVDNNYFRELFELTEIIEDSKFSIIEKYFKQVFQEKYDNISNKRLGNKLTGVILSTRIVNGESIDLILYFMSNFDKLHIGFNFKDQINLKNTKRRNAFKELFKRNFKVFNFNEEHNICSYSLKAHFDDVKWEDLTNQDNISLAKNTIDEIMRQFNEL